METKRDSLKFRYECQDVKAPRHSGRSTSESGTATHDRLYRVGRPPVN